MNRNINDVEFVIFDTETTGLDPRSGDRVIEIAAIRFKGAQRLGEFQSLVNPSRAVSPGAYAVNKISDAMLADAPFMEEIMPGFLKFIQDSCLCSYNAPFDIGFLDNELRLLNSSLPCITVVDILKMARRLLPELDSHALWSVANRVGAKAAQQHRALSDVELTLTVFNSLKVMAAQKGITEFGAFVNLFGVNCGSMEDAGSQKLAEIQRAIDQGLKLKIKYLSAYQAQVTDRQVQPKEIRQERGRLYLVAHCALRGEERSFRVDGILHLEVV